jgi:hypothetical protein
MKLMSFVFIKLFAQEESPFTDDFFQPLNNLFKVKKDKVRNFFYELIDLGEI